MKVVILCGGQGTRIREDTGSRPKPLVEIGGRPVLWHIMKTYAHYGFNDFVLCLGYRGDMIKEYFLNHDGAHDEQNFRVTLADTGRDTMTGGRIKRIEKYVEGGATFLATYGDGVADVDIAQLVAFHKSHGKAATVTAVRPRAHFGLLETGSDGKVAKFTEKPQLDCWASAGFLVFERKVFDYIGDDDCVLEREPLERLAAEGQLMAYRHGGFFFAMDTYREYLHLNELWHSGKAPWRVWK
jgi:glucose-1-phosphate cytidylyltransferase